MGYYGHLRIDEESGRGLAVRVDIADETVVLLDSNQILGTWDADLVAIERLDGDMFRLDFDGERFMFEAADRLAFGYEGIRRLGEAQARLTRGIKGRLRRRRRLSDLDDPDPARPSAGVEPYGLAAVPEPQEPSPGATSAAAILARRPSGAAHPDAPEPTDAPDAPTSPHRRHLAPAGDETEVTIPASMIIADLARGPDDRLASLSAVAADDRTVAAEDRTSAEGVSSVGEGGQPSTVRGQEDIRSSRLEGETAIATSQPPGDPWDQPASADTPTDASGLPPVEGPPPAPAPTADTGSSTPPAPPAGGPPLPDAEAPPPVEVSDPDIEVSGDPGTDAAALAEDSEVVIDLTEAPPPRVGLLGRFRGRLRHEHTYTEDVVSGGIVRRVCSECHHVSIGTS